jgi:hypothetical protein
VSSEYKSAFSPLACGNSPAGLDCQRWEDDQNFCYCLEFHGAGLWCQTLQVLMTVRFHYTIPARRPVPAGTLGYTSMGMSRVRVRVDVWTPAGLPVRIPKILCRHFEELHQGALGFPILSTSASNYLPVKKKANLLGKVSAFILIFVPMCM